MPTAAKVVAAILFAALAWVTSEMIKPLFPDERNVGRFSEVNAVIGLFVGWIVAGSRAKTTLANAVSYGLTATVALVFWSLLLQSFGEMIRFSLNKRYDGPAEAVIGVFSLMYEYGMLMAELHVIATLVIGGILAGLITEFFGRRFR